ncbi:MAG: hypothetical protein WAW96_12650 [Alphaproteobacteria bacterium]
MDDINANSSNELESVLRAIDITVPPRGQKPPTGPKRTKEDFERSSICRWLSTLNRASQLSFPLRASKRERPDFQVCLGQKAWGVEITEAIPEAFAHTVAAAEEENPDALLDVTLFKYGEEKSPAEIRQIISQDEFMGPPLEGDAAERELAEAIRSKVESKTGKLREPDFDKYPRNILLIYENMPVPPLHHDKLAAHCADKLKNYWSDEIVFDVIYVESGDTIFEIMSSGIRQLKVNDLWREA